MIDYNDKINADDQVTMEEQIASVIFEADQADDNLYLGEDDCAELGRQILLMVLHKFRPDLVEEKHDR